MDQQVCITVGASIIATVSTVIAGTSFIANAIKSPEEYTNPVMQWISRIVHFVAFDIVTAVKK